MFFFLRNILCVKGILAPAAAQQGGKPHMRDRRWIGALDLFFPQSKPFFHAFVPKSSKALALGNQEAFSQASGGSSGCQTWVEIMGNSLINSHASSCNHANAIFIVSPQKKGWKWLSIFWIVKFNNSKNSEGKKRSAPPSKTLRFTVIETNFSMCPHQKKSPHDVPLQFIRFKLSQSTVQLVFKLSWSRCVHIWTFFDRKIVRKNGRIYGHFCYCCNP